MTGQPWFFNVARQPPVPKSVQRGCSQNALLWISNIMCIVLAAVCIVWWLFANGSTSYPIPMAIIAVALLINARWVADYVQSRNFTWPCYLHLVVQYALVFAMLWSTVESYVQLAQNCEYVEENWVLLQNTVLIPFTSLLDQKASLRTWGQASFVIGLMVALANIDPLQEAWASVGGTVRMVQGRLPIIVPEFLILAASAVITLYYDETAATTAVYALPHSTAALVWQSACAALALLTIVILFVAAIRWGSTIGFHFLAVLLFLPLAFITLITASVTLQRAQGVEDWVIANWTSGARIQQLVPAAFSGLPADKYALASYTPMVTAGATGIILTLLLWVAVIIHLRCAAILYHVGPELYALATNAADGPSGSGESASSAHSHAQAAGMAAIGMGGIGIGSGAVVKPNPLRALGSGMGGIPSYGTSSSSSTSTPSHGHGPHGISIGIGMGGGGSSNHAAVLGSPTAGMELTSAGHSVGLLADSEMDSAVKASRRRGSTGPGGSLDAPSPSSSLAGAAAGAASFQQGFAAAAGGVRGSLGISSPASSSGGAVTVSMPNSSHGSEYDPIPLDGSSGHAAGGAGGAGGEDGEGESVVGDLPALGGMPVPAGMLFPIGRGASRSVADLSVMIGRALPADTDTSTYKAAIAAATRAYGQYLAAHGLSVVPLRKAWKEKELSERVRMPRMGALWAAWCRDLAYMWAQTRLCIIVTIVLTLAALIGMAVGLRRLSDEGTCGILTRDPVTVSYTTWFTVAPQHYVTIGHAFPFGSVDVEATHVAGALFAQNHNFTVTMTYFGAEASELPSQADFLAAIKTSVPQGGDDDPGAWDFTTITLTPPAVATSASAGDPSRCVGAALRIVTNARQMSYSIASQSALVIFNGNFNDLNGDLKTALPSVQDLNVTTDSGAVVISNVWAEGSDGMPPPVSDPNFYLRPRLNVLSNTGYVQLSAITAPGVTVRTGGNIRTMTLTSSFLHWCGAAACGDITLQTTGSGRIAASQILAANNIALLTDAGTIVAANTAIILGRRMWVTSNSGPIYLSNFLQASGNETIVATHGSSISISAAIVNRLIVSTDGAGKVSVVEGFIGSSTPQPGSSSIVVPYLTTNYSLPLLSITTERGDISILGVGGSPTGGDHANLMSLDLRAGLGSVKVDVNGGGINANYTLVSDRGTEIAEIDGRPAPASGTLGTGGSGKNYIYLYSEGGDVQMSQMASPY